MRKNLKAITIAILLLFPVFITNSCKKKDTFDMHYDYFPLSQDRYVIYSVHEIFVDQQLQQKDTFDYFIKTLVGDTVMDNSNRIARKFERYFSSSASGPWTIHDVWTAIIDGGRAELVEENNRTIKLVFAPSEDDEWDMNAYNTLGQMNCYYSNINQPYTVNGSTFSTTVTVEQEDFSSFIDSRRKYEVYAKEVGMIHKYFKDFIIINGNPNNVKKGHLIDMQLVSYGQQ